MHSRILPAIFLLAATLPLGACAQSSKPDEARNARIVANLKYSIAQLAEVPITVLSLESGATGYDKGVVSLAGQQNVSFLISKDDSELYLLATDAIDASRDASALAALKAEDMRKEGIAARERNEMLLRAASGLPFRGNEQAPITIIEFSDFQCPYCARATDTVEQVLSQYGDEVRLVYLHMPLESLHPWAMDAAVTASCAADLNGQAFWTLHDFLFQNQKDINKGNLKAKASEALGQTDIDMAAWSQCVDSQASRPAVVETQQLGQSLGITGTPAFFINGREINGAQPIEDFHEAIRLARMDMAATK